MWNDLIRRWLDMAFWWLPGQTERDADARPGKHRRTQGPEPSARTEAPPTASERRAETADPAPASTPEAEPSPTGDTPNTSGPTAAAAPASDPASAAPVHDDLTEIKGVGAAMQRRLQAHGITSFADLAAADPERLLRQLKEDKAVISQARVQEWIQAARERAGSASS